MKENKKEIAIGGLLVLLLLALINPGMLLMFSMSQMTLLVLVTVAFAVFATLVWRERGGDERDQLHRLVADRVAFWTTAIALMIGIIAQGLAGMLDEWLPIILLAMVCGKIIGLIYSKKKL